MSAAARDRAATGPRRRLLIATGAVAAMVLSACSQGDSDEPAAEHRVQCQAPTALQVQVTGASGEDSLTIAAGGIGAPPLRSASPEEPPEAPDPEMPVQELPPGLHARVADLSSGEIVRSETLLGGMARTEPLEEGDYLVGLVSVAETGRIAGLATSEVTVDDRGSTVSTPSVAQPRGLSVEELEVDGGTLEAQIAAEDDDSVRTRGWLRAAGDDDGPGGSGGSDGADSPDEAEAADGSDASEDSEASDGSGGADDADDAEAADGSDGAADVDGSDAPEAVTAEEGGALRIDGVEDGEQILALAAESARAPGIVEQAASCPFHVAEGHLRPSAEADGS